MKMYNYRTRCNNSKCGYEEEISDDFRHNIGDTTGITCPGCSNGEMIVIKRSGD